MNVGAILLSGAALILIWGGILLAVIFYSEK